MPIAPDSTSTHRVVAYAGGGATRFEERPAPRPAAGEIRLALRCCGLCGTDLFKLRHDAVPAGTVLGHELVGVVDALGPEVDGFELGDRVVVPHHVACGECALCRQGSETLCPVFQEDLLEPGGFAERVLLRRRAVEAAARRVPETLSDEAAVFLEPAACVLRGIRRGVPRAGDAGAPGLAVVQGAGSMGLLFLLLVRAVYPAIAVVIADPLAARRELALRMGAAAAAAPEDEGLAGAVREMSAGRGADLVFDTVGGPAPLAAALDLTRPGGSVVLFAHARPGDRAGFSLNPFFKGERRLVATYSGSLAEQREVFDLLASGRFDPAVLVSGKMPLSQFEQAVAEVSAHRALKLLLVPDEPA